MTYLKWKLSEGTWGTGPEGTIADRGGDAEASWAVDAGGYRVGYLIQTADLAGLEVWDVTEITEAEALTFCRQLWADAEVQDDGLITGPPPPT